MEGGLRQARSRLTPDDPGRGKIDPVTHATKARLLEEGGECDVLQIATHGYADPDVPESSGLLLGEERSYEVLTALGVYSWPLQRLGVHSKVLGRLVDVHGLPKGDDTRLTVKPRWSSMR
jgi:hypothetical protein